MTLRLNGATSGYTEIDAPATAGNNNLKLPGGNGSDGNILGTDGAGNLSWVNGRMVLETAKASTSGTSIDFTGIPSWVKRVTVIFDGVSSSGTSSYLLQLGDSGGIENTGYTSTSVTVNSASASLGGNSTAGFVWFSDNASHLSSGLWIITNISGNTWIAMHQGRISTTNVVGGGGTKTLSNVLTQLRITTVNGTDTFDAGSINILYEG